MAVFTGRSDTTPLAVSLAEDAVTQADHSFIQAQLSAEVEKLQDAVALMHKDAARARTRLREQAIRRHNEKTHVQQFNVSVGDFVLVAVPKQKRRHKLMAVWRGPRRVVRLES